MTFEQIPYHSTKKISINDLISEGKRQMINAFMPKGYPDSVAKDYWELKSVIGYADYFETYLEMQ